MCLHPEALTWLAAFRQEFYAGLGHRQDSLFELLDAVLTAPDRSPLVRLSLGPAFRRRWPSTCDALADGSIDLLAVRRLFHAHLPAPSSERPLWALDGTHWPRPAAATSAERTYERRVATGRPRDGVVPAWAYQWLVAVPEARGVGSCRWTCADVGRPSDGRPPWRSTSCRRRWLVGHPTRRARWSPWTLATTSPPWPRPIYRPICWSVWPNAAVYTGHRSPTPDVADPTSTAPRSGCTSRPPRARRITPSPSRTQPTDACRWMPGMTCTTRRPPPTPSACCAYRSSTCPTARAPRHPCGWPGWVAHCPLTWSRSGAGTSVGSPSSMGFAS